MLLNKRGFSLIEITISMTIFCLIIAATFSVYNYGAKALAQGGSKWAIRRDVRMAASFITKEVRNATNLDLISAADSPVTGYNYIYLDANDSTIKHINKNGVVTKKTNVNVNSISFTCNNVAGKNVLRFTVNGGDGSQVYEITSDVLLNNISGKNQSADYVICYNDSDFVARAGDGQVNFSFPACTGATSVQLLKSTTSSSAGFTDSGVSLSANSTSATVTGLVNGTQYWFKLAVTGGSKAGNYIVMAKPEALSEPINNLVATAGAGQVSFTFSAPAGASTVQLYQSTTSATAGFTDTGISLNASSTSATVTDITIGTQYWFKLVVTGGAKAGDSNVVTAIPAGSITDLTATSIGRNQVSFTFSAPTGATTVKLYKSTTSDTSGFSDTGVALNADSTSATATGLTKKTQYWFKLVVTGGIMAGDSNVVAAKTTN